MRKVRTKVVIEGDGHASGVSVDRVVLLFSLVSSFRDTLYLSLKGSVRMLPLLPNLRVLDWAILVQEDNGKGWSEGWSDMQWGFLEQQVRNKAGWRRVQLRVLLDLSLYFLVFPPEREALSRRDFIGVHNSSLDDSLLLWAKVNDGS